jgi:hypothetical protein
MDGYVITPSAAVALEAYEHPDVRHVAGLDDGRGFVAFDGLIPCKGSVLEADGSQLGVFDRVRRHGPLAKVRKNGPLAIGDEEAFWYKVRRLAPMGHNPERFFLFANQADFYRNDDPAGLDLLQFVRMATPLTGGRVLAMTDGETLDHVLWSWNAVGFLDKRLDPADARALVDA